jgi:hypothetical protein
MGRLQLKCCKCGNMMETLPGGSQDIIIDDETGEVLYWNGKKSGYQPADCLVCEKCQEKDC